MKMEYIKLLRRHFGHLRMVRRSFFRESENKIWRQKHYLRDKAYCRIVPSATGDCTGVLLLYKQSNHRLIVFHPDEVVQSMMLQNVGYFDQDYSSSNILCYDSNEYVWLPRNRC